MGKRGPNVYTDIYLYMYVTIHPDHMLQNTILAQIAMILYAYWPGSKCAFSIINCIKLIIAVYSF